MRVWHADAFMTLMNDRTLMHCAGDGNIVSWDYCQHIYTAQLHGASDLAAGIDNFTILRPSACMKWK